MSQSWFFSLQIFLSNIDVAWWRGRIYTWQAPVGSIDWNIGCVENTPRINRWSLQLKRVWPTALMHCSYKNSKKEKKTPRSLKFNPSVDSPHICTRKIDLPSKGDRLQNRKIYSAHVYRPPHTWCRRTNSPCFTCRLGRIHCAFFLWQLPSLGGGCSLAWEDLKSGRWKIQKISDWVTKSGPT